MSKMLILDRFRKNTVEAISDFKSISYVMNNNLGDQSDTLALMLNRYIYHMGSSLRVNFKEVAEELNPIQLSIQKYKTKSKSEAFSKHFEAIYEMSEICNWHFSRQGLTYIKATVDTVRNLTKQINRSPDPHPNDAQWTALLRSVLREFALYARKTMKIMPADWIMSNLETANICCKSVAFEIVDFVTSVEVSEKRLCVANQNNEPMIIIENADHNTTVVISDCVNSTVRIPDKPMGVYLQRCKICWVTMEHAKKCITIDGCLNVTLHINGLVDDLFITDSMGCRIYLSKRSVGVEIISRNSRDISFMVVDDFGDFVELPIDDTFITSLMGTIYEIHGCATDGEN